MKLALAGLIVLIVGDSHLASKDFLLASLHADLVEQGAIVHSFGVCGSSPHDWIAQTVMPCGRGERHNLEEAAIDKSPKVKTWSLPELLRRYHPDLLIVELGDNLGGYGILPALPREWIGPQVREMLAPVTARRLPCIWVGPPWGSEGGTSNKTFARVKELSDELARDVAPCRYINSLKFSQPGQWPTYDGEHLLPDSYRIWGADIANEVVKLVPALRRH